MLQSHVLQGLERTVNCMLTPLSTYLENGDWSKLKDSVSLDHVPNSNGLESTPRVIATSYKNIDTCCICLDAISSLDRLIALNCGHIYHYNCSHTQNKLRITKCCLCNEQTVIQNCTYNWQHEYSLFCNDVKDFFAYRTGFLDLLNKTTFLKGSQILELFDIEWEIRADMHQCDEYDEYMNYIEESFEYEYSYSITQINTIMSELKKIYSNNISCYEKKMNNVLKHRLTERLDNDQMYNISNIGSIIQSDETYSQTVFDFLWLTRYENLDAGVNNPGSLISLEKNKMRLLSLMYEDCDYSRDEILKLLHCFRTNYTFLHDRINNILEDFENISVDDYFGLYLDNILAEDQVYSCLDLKKLIPKDPVAKQIFIIANPINTTTGKRNCIRYYVEKQRRHVFSQLENSKTYTLNDLKRLFMTDIVRKKTKITNSEKKILITIITQKFKDQSVYSRRHVIKTIERIYDDIETSRDFDMYKPNIYYEFKRLMNEFKCQSDDESECITKKHIIDAYECLSESLFTRISQRLKDSTEYPSDTIKEVLSDTGDINLEIDDLLWFPSEGTNDDVTLAVERQIFFYYLNEGRVYTKNILLLICELIRSHCEKYEVNGRKLSYEITMEEINKMNNIIETGRNKNDIFRMYLDEELSKNIDFDSKPTITKSEIEDILLFDYDFILRYHFSKGDLNGFAFDVNYFKDMNSLQQSRYEPAGYEFFIRSVKEYCRRIFMDKLDYESQYTIESLLHLVGEIPEMPNDIQYIPPKKELYHHRPQ